MRPAPLLLPLTLIGCHGPTAVTTKPEATKPKDPWPECAAVRTYLRDNLPDPATLEVIEWQGRGRTPEWRPGKDAFPWAKARPACVCVNLKFRAANQYGGKSVREWAFYVHQGKVIEVYGPR